MKRPPLLTRRWLGGRQPWGDEYYHEPSVLAQDVWLHVLALGRARSTRGHEHGHGNENRFLLHYVRRGEFWHSIRGEVHRASAGTICLMNLCEPVRYGNDRDKQSQVWWVYFAGKDMPRLFAELDAESNPIFERVNTARFEELFHQLLALTRRRPPAYEANASGLLTLMLAELFSARAIGGGVDIDLVELPVRPSQLSRPVRDSVRYMARFYREVLPLKSVSPSSGLSMFHFVRVFRKETGLTPAQYLNRYRIEKAKRVLATSDQPMEEIARMVGIPNRFKFFHQFRKLTGVTPEKYRASTRT